MNSVGKAAMDMVNEVRRQFRTIPGILEGTGKPEYGKCVEISTKAALREMIAPGVITIVTPIIVGLVMGAEALGAYMAGVTVSGVLWAIFQNNAGGAWDNAKKSFEKGVEIEVNGKKEIFYKKSEPHKAAVVGDTVGDPFKDTSGPSMNILIKLSSLVGLTIAPLIAITTTHENVVSEPTGRVVEIKASEDISSLNSGTYIVDASHAFVGIELRHFLSRVQGSLSVDTGSINMTGDLKTSSIHLVLDAKSINTGNEKRDQHLKGKDFLAADSLPTITFNSNSIELNAINNNYKYITKGDLTIKGITKPVEIPFNYLGESEIKEMNIKIYSFEGETVVNREEFNIPGGAALGKEITVRFSIETNKK